MQEEQQKEASQEAKSTSRAGNPELEPEQAQVYGDALRALGESGVAYAAGGAAALHAYTGIWRDTKDLDLFLKPQDIHAALDALSEAGLETEMTYPHWLAKAWRGDYFVDLIFRNNNGQLEVDDSWLETGCSIEIAGRQIPVIAIEGLIASKAYIAVRHRFDGADIVHLIHGVEGKLDWQRLLAMLGDDYELLLWHLILFDYVYPGRSSYLPQELMVKIFDRVRARWAQPEDPKAFRGTLIDGFAYQVDVQDWGYNHPDAPETR